MSCNTTETTKGDKVIISIHPEAVDAVFEYESLHQSQVRVENLSDELNNLNDDLLEALEKNSQGQDLSVKLYVWVQETLKEQQKLLQTVFYELDLIDRANKKLLQSSGISDSSHSHSSTEKLNDFMAARLQVYYQCCERTANIVKQTYEVQGSWQNRLIRVTNSMNETTDDRKKLLEVCLHIERCTLELQTLWQELALKVKENENLVHRMHDHVSGLVETTVISKKALQEAHHLQKDIKKKKLYIVFLGFLIIALVLAVTLPSLVNSKPDLIPPWLRKVKK